MISYKVKGIILAVILSLASIMMPFSVYAAVQSTIVPTFSSTTSQWNGHLYVTNFSDGTNNQASSTLSFTLDDDYYGVIYFDGYGPSNQHIANYASVFIAGGYGEYRYSYYQNGVINITSVTINIVNVVKPGSSVDLSQIVTLLTAIESDTTAIDNVLDTTLAQIRLVLAELIESNGYLETLTQLKQWDVPIESFAYVTYFMNNFELNDTGTNYYSYPLFNVKTGDEVIVGPRSGIINRKMIWIFGINKNIWDTTSLSNYITYNNISVSQFEIINRMDSPFNNQFTIIKVTLNNDTTDTSVYRSVTFKQNAVVMPIFSNYIEFDYISTDFALRYGLSNNLLDNIDKIANGTTSSNSAASDLDDASSDYSSIADDVVNVENGLTTNFETEVNKIDLNTGLNVFGGHFLTSATWVRTQFDRLTENTPYGSMVVYGLTLGFVLLMLGKVFL